jgi:hypothetical protein
MVLTRISVIVITLAHCGLLTPVGANRAFAQAAESDANAHLERLEATREATLKSIQSAEKKNEPESATQILRDALKVYDYQIENAKEVIAGGGSFGQAELKAATDAVQLEMQNSLEQMKQQIVASHESTEADRRYAEELESIKAKHREKTEAIDKKFQNTVDVINLKRAFLESRGQMAIVVWNLPIDPPLHQRITPIVNVQLLSREQIVWKRNGIRMDRKQERNLVRLPNVLFDRVRIELPKWGRSGNGLSEVEVVLGKVNVALGRPCEVSSIETLPIHLDDQHALTDGVTQPTELGKGYWIPEERTKASVTIDLLGKKIELAKPNSDQSPQ